MRSVTALASVAALGSALLLTGCSHRSPAPSDASSRPSGTSASTSALAGGDGEQGTAPRSTVFSTPTPKLTVDTSASEIDKACPYATTNDFRDAEGDRTVRSVQLTGNPVGCRYYFEYDPSVIIGEIRIQTFGSKTEAINAVVTAAKGHPEAYGDSGVGDGAVLMKLPLQGASTWACVFAKGNRVVTAQTRQTTVAQDAKNVAILIEPRVP